tara:strand:+ start:990 stop:1184 length:195 start_codon:yes stop_codon:yes gene_type:complete
MKIWVLILQKISQGASYTTVVTLVDKIILLFEKISPTLVLILLTVTTVWATEVIETLLFLREFE